ncbi:hypothetical protein LJR143_001687 [Pseudoxanthomonas sp. LjRoot143]|uniref:hypothetical protein n=1 Tax=Pseudoxanthomonas sp. LjRoot143 TaxID=3342266 RepID=UPI003ECF9351
MFRLADIGKVWVPVVLPIGEGSEGTQIHLRMRLLTRKELRERERSAMVRTASELVATAEKIRTTEDLQRVFDAVTQVEASDLQELADRIDDWRDVVDDAGEPQAFSAERLAACMDYQWFFQAAREALFRASREGVAKN